MSSPTPNADAISRLHAQNQAIEAAMKEAANEAVLVHKRLGLPMVTWKDGKVVLIPAEQLAAE